MYLRGACAALCLFAASAAVARAHLGSTKYIDVRFTGDAAFVDVWLERVDARALIGLAPTGPDHELLQRRVALGDVLVRGIHVSGRGACPLRLLSVDEGVRDRKPYVRVRLSGPCALSAGDSLTLEDTTVFPDDPRHEAIVHLGADGRAVAILRQRRQIATLHVRTSTRVLAWRFFVSGALHFATGYDHILFLVALLLPFGRIAARDGRRRALVAVAWVATAFTLGHSITLALGALGIVVFPSKPVEVLIALSIVLVASARIARPRAHAATPAIALVFGLVHGLGFSSVLDAVGLPTHATVTALFSFNVGIEFAQLAFIGVLLPALALAAEKASYERVVVRGGSIVIATLGLVWVLERLA